MVIGRWGDISFSLKNISSLHLYSDRTGKNIRHYFFILNKFSYGKAQVPHRF